MPRTNTGKRFIAALGVVVGFLALPALADDNPGAIQGSAISIDASGTRTVVPGAKVLLRVEASESAGMEAIVDAAGKFLLSPVPPGRYRISASTQEMASEELAVSVGPGETVTQDVELKLNTLKQSITVDAAASEVAPMTETSQSTVLGESTLKNAPNANERFESLLPLVPGVVRGPDGLINMKGARSSQNGLLLNSANVTDPVTGSSGINLPIDVISSATVVANPYEAEYGKLTGAVATVDTRVSDFEKLHFTMQNLMVRPRRRDGSFVGIESATPRLTVTGPLIRDRVAFTQSLEYRYVRTPVNSLPPMERDMGLESFDSFTQFDLNLTERQSASITVALYPQKLNYLGLNTFTPQQATPDLHQRGDFLAFSHKLVTQSGGLLASQVSYKTFDGDLKPNSTDPYRLEIETTTGGFFSRQHRETGRFEWQEAFAMHPITAWGQHQLKFGGDFVRTAFDSRQTFEPVQVLRSSGMLAERIDFSPGVSTSVRQREYTGFAQDKWSINGKVTLDTGVRVDRDSVSDKAHVAPRLGIALAPFPGGRTVIRGGVGLFYDRINLNIPTFPHLPERTVTSYLPDGSISGVLAYQNRFAGPLDNPRSAAWNVEIQHQLRSNLVVRTGYSQRITVRDYYLDPQQAENTGVLLLSNSGTSRYREFQTTARYQIRKHVINASYVRSKAIGDLNDFNQFFGNTPNPVIRPNERGPLAFDAPNRFLFWGDFTLPWKVTLSPVYDVHTGFPYSIVDEERDFVGARNRAGRFPRFSSTDLQVAKQISLPFLPKKYKAQIGVRVFNIFNHYNPRDLQENIVSDRYGVFLNSVGRMMRGKFVLEF